MARRDSGTLVAMVSADPAPFGALLRRWRAVRRLSQLDLSLVAEVSTRHVSFLEAGRSRPSREMVMLLGNALDLPLREHNALLAAAGFAAVYRETPLEGPAMAGIREALVLILRQHEPFGAMALDRHWNVVLANEGWIRGLRLLLGDAAPAIEPYQITRDGPNAIRLLFDPRGLRPYVANWEPLAGHLLRRIEREVTMRGDAATHALFDELLGFPGVPRRWSKATAEPAALVLPVELRLGDRVVRLFSTIATLGTPQDVTLEELRIEAFHAADPASEALVRALASGALPG